MTAVIANTPAVANDNLLGICAAVGEDLGFDPLYLRLVFATALLLDLEAVLLTYAALGVIVAASRLLFPDRQPVVPATNEMHTPALSKEPVADYRQAA